MSYSQIFPAELVSSARLGSSSAETVDDSEHRIAPIGLQFHPLADLFSLITGAEWDELVDDIRAHGVRESIWVYQGKILDGRNRYRAAQVAGVPCGTRVYDGDDPVGFIISLNLKRRHLNTSQRAMIAAKLADMRQGERTDLPSFEGKSISQQEAAKLLNVGRASVERAKIVQNQGGPELVYAVKSGKISVTDASMRIRRGDDVAMAGKDVSADDKLTQLERENKELRVKLREALAHRITELQSRKSSEPSLLKESEILRKALSHIRAAGTAANSTASDISENQALACLRALATALVDVATDRVTIVNRYAKEIRRVKKSRRAA
jgi:hypothetical protein